MARTIETGKGEAREWADHKEASDILWQAFLNASRETKEEAREAYLKESKEFWGC